MTERRRARTARPASAERRRLDQPRVLVADALQKGWLAFESRGERCRYAPIPLDWHACTDEELAAFLECATSRSTTRRLIE